MLDYPHTYRNVYQALHSGRCEVRVRNGIVNLLLRRRLIIDLYSITVREQFRGRGLMWGYLNSIENEARAVGAFKVVLDGIILTERIAEKARAHGYNPVGQNSMEKYLGHPQPQST